MMNMTKALLTGRKKGFNEIESINDLPLSSALFLVPPFSLIWRCCPDLKIERRTRASTRITGANFKFRY
jgi:hypothetical protein